MVGLINDDNEATYREEVIALAVWCQVNNLSLNVSKTKELIVDYRKQMNKGTEAYNPSRITRTMQCFYSS